VGERTIVASKEDPSALQAAYEQGLPPMAVNGTAVSSWEEVAERFKDSDGQLTIKVWGERFQP
jgi:hypothetical protein